MTICRKSSRIPRSLWAAVAACAFGNPATADAQDSREYPPTYSSRKAPWYDPFGWLGSTEKTPPRQTSGPVTSGIHPVTDSPPAAPGAPAWKWYGYGTPAPSGNAAQPVVPGGWYSSSGATPGALPDVGSKSAVVADPFHPPGVVVDPAPAKWPAITVPPPFTDQPIVVPPANGPNSRGPSPTNIHATDVNWKSTAASLRMPTSGAPLDTSPPARIKPPIRLDETPSPPAAATTDILPPPRTPAEAARDRRKESVDIPVEAAPGIVMPPIK